MSKPTDQGQLDFSLGNQKWELRDATMLTGRPGAAIQGVAKGWTRLSDYAQISHEPHRTGYPLGSNCGSLLSQPLGTSILLFVSMEKISF